MITQWFISMLASVLSWMASAFPAALAGCGCLPSSVTQDTAGASSSTIGSYMDTIWHYAQGLGPWLPPFSLIVCCVVGLAAAVMASAAIRSVRVAISLVELGGGMGE